MILDRIASRLKTLTPERLEAFKERFPVRGALLETLQQRPEILEALKRQPRLNKWGRELVAQSRPLLEEPEL